MFEHGDAGGSLALPGVPGGEEAPLQAHRLGQAGELPVSLTPHTHPTTLNRTSLLGLRELQTVTVLLKIRNKKDGIAKPEGRIRKNIQICELTLYGEL